LETHTPIAEKLTYKMSMKTGGNQGG